MIPELKHPDKYKLMPSRIEGLNKLPWMIVAFTMLLIVLMILSTMLLLNCWWLWLMTFPTSYVAYALYLKKKYS